MGLAHKLSGVTVSSCVMCVIGVATTRDQPYIALTQEEVERNYKLQNVPHFLTCISLVTNDYLPVSWAENTHRFSFEVNLLDLKRFFLSC